MVDATQIELLDRSKRRVLSALYMTAVAVLVLLALRFVPRLNDALSGKPEYIRILTETFARQLVAQTQMQFPVIVEHNESVLCQAVDAPPVPDEEIRGTIYILTYSEQQHLTCITTYVVPTHASKFPAQRSVTPADGKNYGPTFLATVQTVPQDRIFHTYAGEYLKRLHWRYKPHFPLSPNEAASLRSQSYYSGTKPPGDSSVTIDFDYGELRAEVGMRHRKMNVALSSLLASCVLPFLFLLRRLWQIYRTSWQYCSLYKLQLTRRAFLKESVATKLNAARHDYFERQKQTQARLREEEKLRALRNVWQEGLRSALPNLTDGQMRQRVQEFLEHELQDLEQMKSLWIEVQEQTGKKTPAEKLSLLLESAKPYCTDEEFLAGRAEAFAILNKSGFRAARMFAITMHDQFKMRAQEMEELESRDRSIA